MLPLRALCLLLSLTFPVAAAAGVCFEDATSGAVFEFQKLEVPDGANDGTHDLGRVSCPH